MTETPKRSCTQDEEIAELRKQVEDRTKEADEERTRNIDSCRVESRIMSEHFHKIEKERERVKELASQLAIEKKRVERLRQDYKGASGYVPYQQGIENASDRWRNELLERTRQLTAEKEHVKKLETCMRENRVWTDADKEELEGKVKRLRETLSNLITLADGFSNTEMCDGYYEAIKTMKETT